MSKWYLTPHPYYLKKVNWNSLCTPVHNKCAVIRALLFPSFVSAENTWALINTGILLYRSFVYTVRQWRCGKTVTAVSSFHFLFIYLTVMDYSNAPGTVHRLEIHGNQHKTHSKRRKQIIHRSISILKIFKQRWLAWIKYNTEMEVLI